LSPDVRELLAIGRIEKAFGVKGELIIDPMTDSTVRFQHARSVFLGRKDSDVREGTIEHVSVDRRGVRAKLRGVDTRTSAEALVGLLVFVNRANRVPLEKGRHFVHDVIGLRVTDQEGLSIGVVKDVLKLPAHDVYVVDSPGREILLPAVKEFVVSVNLAAGTITMKLIEGMLDAQ
jgi:16S rRNA processing protein RimM